jgi:hypothetical protein
MILQAGAGTGLIHPFILRTQACPVFNFQLSIPGIIFLKNRKYETNRRSLAYHKPKLLHTPATGSQSNCRE